VVVALTFRPGQQITLLTNCMFRPKDRGGKLSPLSWGRLMEANEASLDHIEPISESKQHSIENLQWVLTEINRAKGTMSNEGFIQLCNDVAKKHPRGGSAGGGVPAF
jgi:hypothetical protein